MLDNIGLVHMNGRAYDPAIRRFLSADPFVVPMLGTQGFNRYAYVGNQPLSYVDPTGFSPVSSDGWDDPGNWDWLYPGWDSCFGVCDPGWFITIGDRQRSPAGSRYNYRSIDGNPFNNPNSQREEKEEITASVAADNHNVSTNGGAIWPDWQVAAVTLGSLDLSQGEIEPTTRQATIGRAIRELREAGLVLGSDQIRIDNRYAFVNSLRKPLRSYDIRFEHTAKDAFATMELLNAQPRLVQFVALGGSTEREYLGLAGPFVYTIYAWAAYPTSGGSSLDTAKFIILHEIGHGRGGCGIGRETCANEYAERLLNPK
jgi:RHS repeat-associated protein